jgi:hypothetical protein
MPRGAVRMWIELIPKSKDNELLSDTLRPQTEEKFEIRVVVWKTRDVPLIDDGKVDIMVKCTFNDGKKDIEQETDVHSNSTTGNGEFNWRMIFPCTYPSKKTFLSIALYDYNHLTSNSIISTCNLNLNKYLNKVYRTRSPVIIQSEWIDLEKVSTLEEADSGGQIEMEIRILLQQDADSNKVGKGREEPNRDPQLQEPKEGRNFLDKFTGIGSILDGVTSLYTRIFQFAKIVVVVLVVALIAYLILQVAKSI